MPNKRTGQDYLDSVQNKRNADRMKQFEHDKLKHEVEKKKKKKKKPVPGGGGPKGTYTPYKD